jgi:transcriptional regulator
MTRTKQAQIPPGTLDMLVLKALADGRQHGYGILARLKDATDDSLLVEEGALYPALHRLEARDLVAGEWGESEARRRARYYTLTRAGRAQLAREIEEWERASQAIAKVLALRVGALP